MLLFTGTPCGNYISFNIILLCFLSLWTRLSENPFVYHVLDLFTVQYDSERTRPYILASQKFMMCLCIAINGAGSSWMPLLFDRYVMSTSEERLKLLRFFYIYFPLVLPPHLPPPSQHQPIPLSFLSVQSS